MSVPDPLETFGRVASCKAPAIGLLFDHLVGAPENGGRHRNPERLGGVSVQRQHEFDWYGKLGRRCAGGMRSSQGDRSAKHIAQINSIRKQTNPLESLGTIGFNLSSAGALSCADGSVSVSWDRTGVDPVAILTIRWCEIGSPPIVAPAQFGYGSSLIRDLIPHELGGTVDLVFLSDGLRCKIEIPLRRK